MSDSERPRHSTDTARAAMRPASKRLFLWVLRVAAIVVLGGLMLTWVFHRLLFYPSRDENRGVEQIGGVRVRYRTDDGLTLVGWRVPAHGARRRTVVSFHGNGGTASDRWDWADALARRGSEVLLAEYRGYGASEGSPSARGVERDADAAIRYLLDEQHVSPRELVVHGQSLGGAAAVVALTSAARDAADGILKSTFTSLHDMSSATVGVPLTRLVYDAYGLDSAARAPSIRARLLHLHGDRDEVIPYALGEALQARLRTARFLRVRGGTHNVVDRAARDAMLDFVEEVVP